MSKEQEVKITRRDYINYELWRLEGILGIAAGAFGLGASLGDDGGYRQAVIDLGDLNKDTDKQLPSSFPDRSLSNKLQLVSGSIFILGGGMVYALAWLTSKLDRNFDRLEQGKKLGRLE